MLTLVCHSSWEVYMMQHPWQPRLSRVHQLLLQSSRLPPLLCHTPALARWSMQSWHGPDWNVWPEFQQYCFQVRMCRRLHAIALQ